MRGAHSCPSSAVILLIACGAVSSGAEQVGQPAGTSFPPSRALAGVRIYDDETISALARLAACSDLLAGLRADPRWLVSPEAAAQVTDPLQRALLEQLSRRPEAVSIALAHPEAHAALGRALLETPEGAALRLAELREAFERAARRAALDWQRALENDPVALGEYRDLVTRFCHTQRMVRPDFPCVQVLDRSYYYACPPDEAIVEYGMQHGLPPALRRVLARFWREHSPVSTDARILRRGTAPRSGPAEEGLAAAAVEDRRGMFSELTVPDPATVGLVPVMLQPLADRPQAAREAFALAEHERLWEPEPGSPGQAAVAPIVRDRDGAAPPRPGTAEGRAPEPKAAALERGRPGYVVRERPGYEATPGVWDSGGWPGYVYGSATLIWTEAGWCRLYLLPFTRWGYVPSDRECRTRYFRNYGYPYGDWVCGEAERATPREQLVYSRGLRVGPGGWPVRNQRTATGIGRVRQYPSAVHQVRPPCDPERVSTVRRAESSRRMEGGISPAGGSSRTRGAISPARPVRPVVQPSASPARPPRPEIRRSQWPGASSGHHARAGAAPMRPPQPVIMRQGSWSGRAPAAPPGRVRSGSSGSRPGSR